MQGCLFCGIVAGTVPADVIFEDSQAVAIRDINPQAPVHVLVIPRRHIAGYSVANEEDEPLLGHIARVAALVADRERVSETGFRCVVNSGPHAQQSVDHLHVHVLGGRQMTWPPG